MIFVQLLNKFSGCIISRKMSKIEQMMGPSVFLVCFLSLLASFAAAQENKQPDPAVPTKKVMGEIYESLRSVLPYSLSQEKFSDPKSQKQIRENLKKLAESAKILPSHTEFHDATFKYLGGSLARDAKEIYRRFDRGNTREALYLIGALTDNCIACHSRLPSKDSSRAEGLFKDIDIATLPLEEKARLYLVTRQFDKSMQAYKEAILSDRYTTANVCLADWISDYLAIAVRVKRDFPDVAETLTKFLSRKDLPLSAEHEARSWQNAALKFSKVKELNADLPTVRKLIKEGKEQIQFPLDRQGLVHYLLASSLLHEFVQHSPKGIKASEAYYLLGVTESMTGRSFWLSQNHYYLETAIRSAPESKFAYMAYRQLEETILFENSGSSGVDVPQDLQEYLGELHSLIRSKRHYEK